MRKYLNCSVCQEQLEEEVLEDEEEKVLSYMNVERIDRNERATPISIGVVIPGKNSILVEKPKTAVLLFLISSLYSPER